MNGALTLNSTGLSSLLHPTYFLNFVFCLNGRKSLTVLR